MHAPLLGARYSLAASAAKRTVTVVPRLALEGARRVLGHHVNTVAQGDEMKVEKSGLPSYGTPNRQARDLGLASNVTFVPQNVRMSQGNGSGVAKSRINVQKSAGDSEP